MIVVACLLTITIAVSAYQATGTDGDGSRPAFLPETDFAWKAVFTAKGPVTSIAAGGPEAVWASDNLSEDQCGPAAHLLPERDLSLTTNG